MAVADDTSLSRDSKNKMMFSGKIEIGVASNVHRTPWAELIKAAKAALPCWNVDTQVIWDAFRAFNRARGNSHVPAGYLLGFLRKWRSAPGGTGRIAERVGGNLTDEHTQAYEMARHAPVQNREFHRQDLEKLIGIAEYEARIAQMMAKVGLGRFAATLAVHGEAVRSGEIAR